MKPYFGIETSKLFCGDCIDVLKEIPDNSIDTIITDPPYGLSFMGKKWDYDVPSIEIWKECLRILKPGGTLLCFAGSRTQHRMAVNVEDAGFILKDCIMWLYGSGFPKATDISKQLDKGKRKVTGTYKTGYSKSQLETGYRPKEYECKITDSNPVTDEAKLWNGWKSHGLKPAYEPILVCMKPNEGSYAENAIKHGVSGLNIDGGRISTSDKYSYKKCGGSSFGVGKDIDGTREYPAEINVKGRFPANIILDEEAAKMLDEQSGEVSYGNKSGASRFFYTAKASKSERNVGCEGLEEKIGGGMAGTQDQTLLTGSGNVRDNKMKNNHPTVKPLKLMEYLCTLTKTPTGGIVLDPFAGSGTTGIACVKTNRKFIGIERDEEYCEIAKHRIEFAHNQIKLENKQIELDLKGEIKCQKGIKK